MHNQIIPKFREKPTQTLAEKLKEQYKETLDLIIQHEWVIDLLNSKLTLSQFESFIAQEAYLYDQIAKHLLKFDTNKTNENYDELIRIGIFLYSEASENLKPLNDKYSLSCFTKSYSERLQNIWNEAPYLHKILTILIQLWIREGTYHILINEMANVHDYKFWAKSVVNSSYQKFLDSLSRILNQTFSKDYGDDEEGLIYQEGFKELGHLLSNLIQHELLIRNHSYHITDQQLVPIGK